MKVYVLVKTWGDNMGTPVVRVFTTFDVAEAALKVEYYKVRDEFGEEYLDVYATSLMRMFATVVDGMGSYVNLEIVEADVEEE